MDGEGHIDRAGRLFGSMRVGGYDAGTPLESRSDSGDLSFDRGGGGDRDAGDRTDERPLYDQGGAGRPGRFDIGLDGLPGPGGEWGIELHRGGGYGPGGPGERGGGGDGSGGEFWRFAESVVLATALVVTLALLLREARAARAGIAGGL